MTDAYYESAMIPDKLEKSLTLDYAGERPEIYVHARSMLPDHGYRTMKPGCPPTSLPAALLAGVLPEPIITQVASAQMWEDPVYPEEQIFLRRAIAKRRRDFSAGRGCSRAALRALGFERFPVLMGAQREPLWPAGVVGSISHCEGYCMAAVCRSSDILALGIDVERDEDLSAEVAALACAPSELHWCRHGAPHQALPWAKIIFSAKESLFKCVYPLTGLELGFTDVDIIIEPSQQRFVVRPNRPTLDPGWVSRICGRFALGHGLVFTSAALPSRC